MQIVTERGLSVLIVAQPTRLRDSLQAIVRAVPRVERVNQADDASTALETILETHPDLILLDADLPYNGASAVLRQIRLRWPWIQRAVLIGNSRGGQSYTEAVLDKSLSAATLVENIGRLLP